MYQPRHAAPPDTPAPVSPTGAVLRLSQTFILLIASLVALCVAIWTLNSALDIKRDNEYRSLMRTATEELVVPGLGPDQLGQWCVDRKAQGTAGLSSRARAWLNDCITLFGSGLAPSPTTSPTPTPSPSQTPSPSPSTTPAPSPSVSPTVTTPPAPSPSVSPTPSPTSTQTGCMPIPSACGWPDATNTGIPPGTALTLRTGDQHLNVSGVYSGLDINGCVYIEASNITIRDSRIRGECWYSIRTFGAGSPTGLIVEDSEIVLARGLEGSYGICCSNYTLTRVHIHANPAGNQGADCVYLGTNNVVRDSYCVVGLLNAGSAGHADGFQSDGGSNYTLDHNTIRNPNPQTSAILMSTNSGAISNVRITDNLVAGGGYTVYCGTDSGGPTTGLTFTGNRIARTYFPNGGYWGPVTSCPAVGWAWD